MKKEILSYGTGVLLASSLLLIGSMGMTQAAATYSLTPSTEITTSNTRAVANIQMSLKSELQRMYRTLGAFARFSASEDKTIFRAFLVDHQAVTFAKLEAEVGKITDFSNTGTVTTSLKGMLNSRLDDLKTGWVALLGSNTETYGKFIDSYKESLWKKVESNVKRMRANSMTGVEVITPALPQPPAVLIRADDSCMGVNGQLPVGCTLTGATPSKPPVTVNPVTPTPSKPPVTVTPPTSGIQVEIVGTTAAMNISGSIPNPQAKISGGTAASVGFFMDGKLRHTERYSPYCAMDLGETTTSCLGKWDTTKNIKGDGETTVPELSNGAHSFTVKAFNADGVVVGEKSVALTVANGVSVVTPPPVVVTPPPVVVTPPPVVVTPPPVVVTPPITNGNILGLTACLPGSGTDYVVWPTGKYASPVDVPWESLKAGDTVRLQYNNGVPYKAKFMISGNGTASAPIRVCGIKGANGERPILEGDGAKSRSALLPAYGNSTYTSDIHQGRSIIAVKQAANSSSSWTDTPSYIQIDGLEIRKAHPNYSFTDASGVTQKYIDFGACIWLERGKNVTIADNVVHDCSQGLFSKSTDDGSQAQTENLRVAGNYFYDHGISGDVHMHGNYVQTIKPIYEFNRYGAVKTGASGNSLKDRSVGSIIRYNVFEDGARAIDLVEAEDFPTTAKANPAYRATYVYGNIFNKIRGSAVHYGWDHFGATPGSGWGEENFRKGTLYFWNNTVYYAQEGTRIFQVSTTEERVEAWNNAFVFAPSIALKGLRSDWDEVYSTYTRAGTLNFGKNWINSDWVESDQYHPITSAAPLLGTANFIKGTSLPIDTNTLAPLAGSALVDAAQANLSAVAGYPVQYQIDVNGKATVRPVNGATDIGAIEK